VGAMDKFSAVIATIRPDEPTPLERPGGVVLHHSGTRKDAPLQAIRSYHMAPRPEGKGWTELGYHWYLSLVGESWVAQAGRPENRRGAHAPGRNSWIGVCVAGDYHPRSDNPGDEPSPEMIDVLVNKLVDICRRHRISPALIRPHSDTGCEGGGPTDCPGHNLEAVLPEIREQVSILLGRKD